MMQHVNESILPKWTIESWRSASLLMELKSAIFFQKIFRISSGSSCLDGNSQGTGKAVATGIYWRASSSRKGGDTGNFVRQSWKGSRMMIARRPKFIQTQTTRESWRAWFAANPWQTELRRVVCEHHHKPDCLWLPDTYLPSAGLMK